MRSLLTFPCAGETLAATLDAAPGATGLLIVSGGNEIRIGAHRGMAMLAQRIAEAGHPVFRFDRRGIGDSTGENCGFRNSGEDIAGAAAAFRAAMPSIRRVVGFGNCDAATALALFHRAAGLDALVLANPWVVEPTDDLPPASAIRARYAARLRDPRAWARLLTGGVDLRKLARGLSKAAAPPPPATLAEELARALDATLVPLTILLAGGDNTAIAFREAWRGEAFDDLRALVSPQVCDTDSHSFARVQDKHWLFERVRAALRD